MIRCQICGREVINGWICGATPADDKFKLGLCPEHDTRENRADVERDWEELMVAELERAVHAAPESKSVVKRYEVTIDFLDGGVKKLETRLYNVNQDQELLILSENGDFDFYPLRHIRTFKVREIRGQEDWPLTRGESET